MEATEAADRIREAAEEQEQTRRAADERFRRRAAVAVGVLAMLLAITHLAGANATKDLINTNILASDTYAFYQAKNIRQTSTRLADEQLELQQLEQPNLAPEAAGQLQRRRQEYQAAVARLESDPATGEGKQELLARAQNYEEQRGRALQQSPNFEYAEALFQIAIVLGSVSIVAAARWLLGLGLVLVAGAELNAFLEEPGRATALAASKARAEKGQAAVSQAGGRVQAEATGTAWAGGQETPGAGQDTPGPSAAGRPGPAPVGARAGGGSFIAGKLIGFAGLAVAALLLRAQRSTAAPESSARPG